MHTGVSTDAILRDRFEQINICHKICHKPTAWLAFLLPTNWKYSVKIFLYLELPLLKFSKFNISVLVVFFFSSRSYEQSIVLAGFFFAPEDPLNKAFLRVSQKSPSLDF